MLSEFEVFLRDNSGIGENTIRTYINCMRLFIDYIKSDVSLKCDVGTINKFLTEYHGKGKRLEPAKYAFKWWFYFQGEVCDSVDKLPVKYKQLVRLKALPRKRVNKTISPVMVVRIIEGITHPVYKDIASLQYATGARAAGIITLREEYIDWDYSDKLIKMVLIEKGNKEKPVFILKSIYAEMLSQYCDGSAGYLFLEDSIDKLEPRDKNTKVSNMRQYYYTAVKASAKRLGLDGFGTHDFRRVVARVINKKKGLYATKKALGHAKIETTVKYFEDEPEDVLEALEEHQEA